MLIGGEARSMEDLPRRDFAEAQMRRQVRGVVLAGKIAPLCVALDCLVEKIIQPLVGAGFSGRPLVTKPTRPVWMRGLKPPVLQVFTFDRCDRRWEFPDCRKRAWLCALRPHTLPERR